jgi:hypothetical protein
MKSTKNTITKFIYNKENAGELSYYSIVRNIYLMPSSLENLILYNYDNIKWARDLRTKRKTCKHTGYSYKNKIHMQNKIQLISCSVQIVNNPIIFPLNLVHFCVQDNNTSLNKKLKINKKFKIKSKLKNIAFVLKDEKIKFIIDKINNINTIKEYINIPCCFLFFQNTVEKIFYLKKQFTEYIRTKNIQYLPSSIKILDSEVTKFKDSNKNLLHSVYLNLPNSTKEINNIYYINLYV